MSFVFIHHPVVIVLFALTFLSTIPAARSRRAAIWGGLCVVCTVALALAALARAVPYEEILLLLLAPLLLFWFLAKEGKTRALLPPDFSSFWP